MYGKCGRCGRKNVTGVTGRWRRWLQVIFEEITGAGLHFRVTAGDGAIVSEYRCPFGHRLVPFYDIR